MTRNLTQDAKTKGKYYATYVLRLDTALWNQSILVDCQ